MKRRVFIADDDPIVVDLVKLRLSMADYDVMSANDGRMALYLIERAMPSVILLDVSMPGCDGISVLHKLKANPQTASLPVMMLTGEREPQIVIHALETGAADYVVKPFKPDELLQRVDRLAKSAPVAWNSYQEHSWID